MTKTMGLFKVPLIWFAGFRMNTLFSKTSLLAILAIAFLFSSNSLGFDDWPQWRGPKRNDISSETGLLKEWPAEGPKKVWTNQNAGLGYAGFAVVGEHLFTLGLEDDDEFAICLNVSDGTEVWKQSIGSRYKNGWGDGPRSTPTVKKDHVYVMGANGDLACLKKSDGSKVWSVKMTDFGGKVPNWGYAESPLVDGDKVICTPGGKKCTMVALNKDNGEEIWQSKPVTEVLDDGTETGAIKAHYSSIFATNLNNRRQYVQLLERAIIGIDADSGELIWQSNWPGRVAVIPSPIVDKNRIYVTSGYGVGAKLVELDENNAVTDLWYTKAMQNHHGAVVKIGDHFYGSSAKAWVCQNEKDGSMVWADRKIKKGCVTHADGMFYHVEESSGRVLLLKADPEDHKIVSQFKMEPQTKQRKPKGKIWVHPVIANGKLYVRDQEIIICYDIKAE